MFEKGAVVTFKRLHRCSWTPRALNVKEGDDIRGKSENGGSSSCILFSGEKVG